VQFVVEKKQGVGKFNNVLFFSVIVCVYFEKVNNFVESCFFLGQNFFLLDIIRTFAALLNDV